MKAAPELVVAGVLEEFELAGYPKTSGRRGLHVCVRIKPRWTYDEVRRCARAPRAAQRLRRPPPNTFSSS